MNEFDKLIRKKISGYESQVPNDIWAKISQGLEEQQKPPVRPYWGGYTIAILLVVAIAGLWFNPFSVKPLDHEERIEMESKVNVHNSNFAALYDANSAIALEKFYPIQTPTPLLESTTDLRTHNSKESKLYSTRRITNKAAKTIESSYNSIVTELPDPKIADHNKGNMPLYQQYGSILRKANNIDDLTTHAEVIDRNAIDEAQNIEENQIKTLTTLRVVPSMLLTINHKPNICPSFAPKQLFYNASIVYSSDYGVREFEEVGPTKDSDYKLQRETTELPYYSHSAQLRVGVQNRNGFGLQTGAHYTEIREKFKFSNPNSHQIKTIKIKEYSWENGVIVDSTETTKEIVMPGTHSITNVNKYRLLDIPLIFNYEFGGKGRWSYGVSAGPMINMALRVNGRHLPMNNAEPQPIINSPTQYKSKIGSSLYASVYTAYQIDNLVSVYAEPNFRHYFNSISNNNSLDQKYSILGMAIGVKVQL